MQLESKTDIYKIRPNVHPWEDAVGIEMISIVRIYEFHPPDPIPNTGDIFECGKNNKNNNRTSPPPSPMP